MHSPTKKKNPKTGNSFAVRELLRALKDTGYGVKLFAKNGWLPYSNVTFNTSTCFVSVPPRSVTSLPTLRLIASLWCFFSSGKDSFFYVASSATHTHTRNARHTEATWAFIYGPSYLWAKMNQAEQRIRNKIHTIKGVKKNLINLTVFFPPFLVHRSAVPCIEFMRLRIKQLVARRCGVALLH